MSAAGTERCTRSRSQHHTVRTVIIQCIHTYRLCQLQYIGPVRDGTAVPGVADERTRQKHGTKVVAIQHVHGECGGGCAPLAGIRGSVLGGNGEKEGGLYFNFQNQIAVTFTLYQFPICMFVAVPRIEGDWDVVQANVLRKSNQQSSRDLFPAFRARCLLCLAFT